MQIQINTDRHIESNERLIRETEASVRDALERFSAQVTRVEVHLSDENNDQRGGASDKRCLLEARVASLQPIAVKHEASTVQLAVDGAAEKLKRSLESTLGRLGHR